MGFPSDKSHSPLMYNMNIHKANAIQGWMSEDELKFLATVAEHSNLTIEFGCYKGRSTRALADNTKGRVIAVDPWAGIYLADNGSVHGIKTDVFNEFYLNLKDKIEDGTVIPVQEYSTAYYTKEVPDFVFIDGDHRYETVKGDIRLGLRLLQKGGILAGHDYTHSDWPGVKKAVDEFYPEVNLIDSIWWVHVNHP